MRKAILAGAPQWLELMRAFYAEAGLVLADAHAAKTFATLLADEPLGAGWLLEGAGKLAGHLVLTWCYSMEYGGTKVVLDDFYEVPSRRGCGMGQGVLAALPDLCRARGLRAVSVEAGLTNAIAPKTYRRAGIAPVRNHEVLTLTLRAPSHQL
jgi:GNAT superfamily N-acetyltransferase